MIPGNPGRATRKGKMARLTVFFDGRFAESARLEDEIRSNLASVGYEK